MNFKEIKLGDCLEQIKDSFDIQDDINYKQITVSNTGQIKLRGIKKGNKIGTKSQFYATKDFFIYSRLGLHTGAFGLVPDFLDGAIVTGDMPVFKINEYIILKDFLILTLNTDFFLDQIKGLNKGVAQSRIREKVFLDLKIKVPEIVEQKKILEKYNLIKENYDKLQNINTQNQNYIKLLKQSILQEAIEGKLTKSWREKNKDIEPASVLLEKIKAEKEELIKQKKLKKQKELKPIEKDEIPFEIPESWEWCRLGEIYKYIQRGPSAKYSEKSSVGIVNQKCIRWDKINYTFIKYYNISLIEKLKDERYLQKRDILVNSTGTGTIGRCYLINDIEEKKYIADSHVTILRENSGFIDNGYINIFLKSDKIQDFINNGGIGGSTNQIELSKAIIEKFIFPLPPLQEQKEIVKKVDELMKFCDELEKQTLEAKESSENLMKAVLGEVFSK